MPPLPTVIVGSSTPAYSSTSGTTTAAVISAPVAGAEPSHEKRGVSTIAIASDAATPGAIRIGENMRASVITMMVFAIATIPGIGLGDRSATITITPSSNSRPVRAAGYSEPGG